MRTFKHKQIYTKKQIEFLFNNEIPKRDNEVLLIRNEDQTIKIMKCFRLLNGKMILIKNSYGKQLYDCWFYY